MSSAQRPDTLTVAFVITASDLARGKDQLGALVANIPDGVGHRIPLECRRRFALVQHDLFSTLFGRGRVQPFPGKLGRQHDRAPIVYVDHSPSAVGGNDDKPIVLTCAFVGVRELTYGRTQGRGSIAAPNQIGLLLGAVIINPLKPVVDGSNGAVWPDRPDWGDVAGNDEPELQHEA